MQGNRLKNLRLVRAFGLGLAIVSLAAWHGPAGAEAPEEKVEAAAQVPEILSPSDRARYREIFDVQERGDWRAADRLIRKLDDRILMGHVLAQRYLHPTHYRSRYGELAAWMKEYADHPDARRIYNLARTRKPIKARAPVRPDKRFFPAYETAAIIEHSGYRAVHSAEKQIVSQVRRMVWRRELTSAGKYIARKDIARKLGPTGLELARTHIASGWFFHGDSKIAYRDANLAAKRAGTKLPYAHWIAGLSAFRLGDYVSAADHFEAVTQSSDVSGWDHAAAAFWAARANMTGKRPERVNRFLRMAAEEPHTFYGIVARRWLGDTSPFDWTPPRLTPDRLTMVTDLNAGRRALALLEAGMTRRAERELRFLAHTGDPKLTEALVAIADRESLPMVSLRAGLALPESEKVARTPALYPVPNWKPKEGFTVDRALIFAFMRQESAFNARAKSSAGARGLMQLMPATAGFIAQKRFSGRSRNQLYDPALNMSLGQKYILHLMENDHIKGDLLLVAAAYNGGPGNLKKWQRRAERNDYADALMFIESIPARETRIFIERVLSNLWMYRERLGEPSPSLDALAAGERPFYIAVDGAKGVLAEDLRPEDVRN